MHTKSPRLIILGAIDTPCYIRAIARFSRHNLTLMIHKDLSLPEQDDNTRFEIVTEAADLSFLSTQHVTGVLFDKPLVHNAEHIDETPYWLTLCVPEIKIVINHIKTMIHTHSEKVHFSCPEDVNFFMHQKSACFRNKGYTRPETINLIK